MRTPIQGDGTVQAAVGAPPGSAVGRPVALLGMTARRPFVVGAAAVLLVVYVLASGAFVLIGGAARQRLEADAVRVLLAVQSVGHGTLQLDRGFVAAMAVSLVVAPLPIAARVLLPRLGARAAWALAAVVVLLVVLLGAAFRLPSGTHAISVALGCVVGLAFGVLVDLAARSLAALRGHETEGPTGRSRWIALALMVLYVVAVMLIAFHGSPVDAGSDGFLFRVLDWSHRHGTPQWIGYAAVEFTANIVYFVPLGILVALLIGVRRWWLPVAIGFVASAFIEVVQSVLLPERTGSVDDVLSNTAGALLGTLVGIVVLARLRRRAGVRQLG